MMFLSNNKDDDLFIDNNLIENLFKSNKNQLKELEIKTKEVPKQKDRLSKSLFRAAYELTADAPSDIFAQITNELALKGFGTLTKEKLKEEVIIFMTTENRPYIQEVIAKVLFSAVVQEILNVVRSCYDVKFVLYNCVNLALIAINHSSCLVDIVVFAVEFNDNACKLCTVTPLISMTMLVNCVPLHLSLTQTFYKFFKMKRTKRSRKMSKKWIWNLKKINMDESMCRTHTQDHQLYTSRKLFLR